MKQLKHFGIKVDKWGRNDGSENYWTCPKCNAGNNKYANNCWNCGANLRGEE